MKIDHTKLKHVPVDVCASPLAAMRSGAALIMECRGQTMESIQVTDKTTGAKNEMVKLTLAMEFTDGSGKACKVNYRYPKGAEVFPLEVVRGALYVVTFTTFADVWDGCSGTTSLVESYNEKTGK